MYKINLVHPIIQTIYIWFLFFGFLGGFLFFLFYFVWSYLMIVS